MEPLTARRSGKLPPLLLLLLLLLLPILLFPACRLKQGEMAAEVRGLRQPLASAVQATLSGDGQRLGIRFRLKGKDAWAIARPGTTQVTALTFQPDHKSVEVWTGPRTSRVPVFGPGVWRAVADTLALRLAPADESMGTLILAGGRELIAHQVGGKGRLTPLEERPPRLRIGRRLGTAELAREVFTARNDALDRPAGTGGPVLMLTGNFPELVYLDHAARRLVFLTIPAEEATGLPLGTFYKGRTAARQLTSFVWRSNILAIVKNPFSTVSRMLASGTTITQAGIGRLLSRLPLTPPPPYATGPMMDLKQWQVALEAIASAPASEAALRIRIGGNEFFPDLIQAFQNARRRIDVQIYIFDNDDYATGLADLLRRRSMEQVRVRVLLDESGSISAAGIAPDSPMPADFVPPPNIVSYLRRGSKVRVRAMPMSGLSASHTKIITVDDGIAWLGGMNFGREYRSDWHDMMVEVRGPLVAWIRKDFASAWARHGWGGDLALARQQWFSPAEEAAAQPVPPGAIRVQPLYTSSRKREIVKAQLKALARCQRRAWVENAYLSDHAYIDALIQARHRGVDVRLILPADNDNGIMAANNRALVPLLRSHGIRVFLLPGMSHVKAALYDGWACVGSANFDRLSLRVNQEFSIGFDDPVAVNDLRRRLFEADFRRSREVTTQPQPGATDELMNILIRSLAGQL